MMKYRWIWLISALLLTGCSGKQGTIQALNQDYNRLSDVQVLQANNQTLVVIPSSILFEDSNHLTKTGTVIKPAAFNVITEVARLIRIEQPDMIEIFAYVGHDVGDPASAKKITTDRADHLAAYLWTQGIEPSVMVYRGMGQSAPIASNQTPRGLLGNDRVEVRWTIHS